MLTDHQQYSPEYQAFLMACTPRHINIERPVELALAICNTSETDTKAKTAKKKNRK